MLVVTCNLLFDFVERGVHGLRNFDPPLFVGNLTIQDPKKARVKLAHRPATNPLDIPVTQGAIVRSWTTYL